jgi:hypothetical protein
MAIAALTDARIWLNAYDLSGTTNQVGIEASRVDLDVTNFDSGGWQENIGGRLSTTVNVAGFLDFAAGKSEEAFAASWGGNANVLTVAADDTAGSTAVFGKGFHGELVRLGGAPGTDVAKASGAFMSNGTQVEGQIFIAKATQTGTSGNSGVIQLGAVSATERVYVALHVFGVTGGGTLGVLLASDDSSGFGSATTRVTMANATTAGAEFKSAAGAIADDYWRVSWTLDQGTATFAVVAGIL